MSWQTYVDEHLMYEVSPGHSLAAAAIDSSMWAQSAAFPEGSGRCCIKKTGSTLLIQLYNKPCTSSKCNIAMEKLDDYFVNTGFLGFVG